MRMCHCTTIISVTIILTRILRIRLTRIIFTITHMALLLIISGVLIRMVTLMAMVTPMATLWGHLRLVLPTDLRTDLLQVSLVLPLDRLDILLAPSDTLLMALRTLMVLLRSAHPQVLLEPTLTLTLTRMTYRSPRLLRMSPLVLLLLHRRDQEQQLLCLLTVVLLLPLVRHIIRVIQVTDVVVGLVTGLVAVTVTGLTVTGPTMDLTRLHPTVGLDHCMVDCTIMAAAVISTVTMAVVATTTITITTSAITTVIPPPQVRHHWWTPRCNRSLAIPIITLEAPLFSLSLLPWTLLSSSSLSTNPTRPSESSFLHCRQYNLNALCQPPL